MNEKEFNKKISGNVEIDSELVEEIFSNDKTLIKRELKRAGSDKICCVLFHLDGMTNGLLVSESILKPLERFLSEPENRPTVDVLSETVISNGEVKKTCELNALLMSMMNGDCILLTEGGALIIGTKGWMKRTTQEPSNEKVIRGPRESFIESALTNVSLLRKKLQTTEMRVELAIFGELTNTRTYLCYLENRVNKQILAELKRRLAKIQLEGIIDSNYLLEQIRDAPYSPFKTVGVTERPDIVAAKMMEGRIALIVDGTPCVLTLPYLFIENFQSNDDYYTNYIYATINRYLRMIGFFLTVSVPSIYVAIVTYHQEVLPPALLLSISASRQGVPFPTIVEMITLLIAFEILREASVRMSNNVGQALSIVGALVLGQAAVEAKLVSAPMVIIIALTGTTSMLIPTMSGAEIVTRSGLLALTAMFGMVGFTLGYLILFFHLGSLRTFGIPYLSLADTRRGSQKNDSFVRARWGRLRYRKLFAVSEEELKKGIGGERRDS